MALAERKVQETTIADDNVVQTTRSVENPAAEADHGKNVAVRIIWYIAGIIMTLLGIRFLLALLAANEASGFGNFIFSITQPLVSPFFDVFSYTPATGQSRVELYTLLAMLVYGLVAYAIAKLFTLNRRQD